MIIKGGLQGQPGNPTDPNDEGVFISKVNEGSVAERTADLYVGQRIIEVNGQSLLGATHQEAVSALRNAGDSIHLLLCDGFDDPEAQPKALMSPSSSEESARSPTSSVVAVEKQETESVKEVEEQPQNLQDKVRSNSKVELGLRVCGLMNIVILGYRAHNYLASFTHRSFFDFFAQLKFSG